MTYDFSHLFKTETVFVTSPDGEPLFEVVVKQVTNGDMTQAQARMLSEIKIPDTKDKKRYEREMKREMQKLFSEGKPFEKALFEEVVAIQSWTLTDAQGDEVPVHIDVWKALPAWITQQVTPAIERLNPDLDEDFRSDDGSESTD